MNAYFSVLFGLCFMLILTFKVVILTNVRLNKTLPMPFLIPRVSDAHFALVIVACLFIFIIIFI